MAGVAGVAEAAVAKVAIDRNYSGKTYPLRRYIRYNSRNAWRTCPLSHTDLCMARAARAAVVWVEVVAAAVARVVVVWAGVVVVVEQVLYRLPRAEGVWVEVVSAAEGTEA